MWFHPALVRPLAGNFEANAAAGIAPARRATLHALIWVAWGSLSPRTLRMFLRAMLHGRNAMAKPLLRDRAYVEWKPYEARLPARSGAAPAFAQEASPI